VDGRKGDNGGTNVEKEKDHHDRHYDRPLETGRAEIFNRRLDEVGLPEDPGL